ncbi:MAG: hypothetical protein WD431_16765, partial [Cyclobacteriaceae bacterium]
MKKLILFIITIVLFSCNSTNKKLDNTIYAFNNCIRSLPGTPETLEDQVELIKEIGFDGIGGHTSQDYFKLRVALDEEGLKMPEIYWGIEMDS